MSYRPGVRRLGVEAEPAPASAPAYEYPEPPPCYQQTPPATHRRRPVPPCPQAVPTEQGGETVAVVTSHTYGRYLPACLDSLLGQSVPFREIIVVDDASTDDTAAVCRRYAGRVRYLRGEWRNFTAARNAGAALVTTTPAYWLFVDADDRLTPRYHELLRDALSDPSIGVAYPQMRLCDPSGAPQGLAPYVRPFDYDALRYANFVCASSLIRREVWEQVGPWEDEESGAGRTDWLLWLKTTRAGWGMRLVPEAELLYRVHPQSMSRTQTEPRDIGPSVYRRGCLTAVVTLFSGREWALPQYERWVCALDWEPRNLHLVAVDNSDGGDYSDALRTLLASLPAGAVTYVRDPQQALPGVTAAQLAASTDLRVQHMHPMNIHLARLYAVARSHTPAGADFVWSVEDDIEPPPHALTDLSRGLYRYPEAGVVNGIVRSRYVDGMIAWGDEGWEHSPLRSVPAPGEYRPVSATGFGCALFRGDVWDRIPFRRTVDIGTDSRVAYDWSAAHFVRTHLSRTWLLSGDVACKHWQDGGRWV